MINQEKTMTENYVKCRCRHCDKSIEFEASNSGVTVECPHCKLETLLFIAPPEANSPPTFSMQSNSTKGIILDYEIQTNTGIISGDDGKRYSFNGSEWKDKIKFPVKGDKVDFVIEATHAKAIYLIESSAGNHKCDRLIAALLAIFLGAIGIHKFYMGKKESGIVYILIMVLTCGYGIILTALIGLFEGIFYLTATQSEFESKYVNSKRKFF